MKRLLLAASLGAALFGTHTSANACEFRKCAWGEIVCSAVYCPRYCVTATPVVHPCVIN